MSSTYFPIPNLILLRAGGCGLDMAREALAVTKACDACLTRRRHRVDWALKVGACSNALTVQFAESRVALAVIEACIASLAGDTNGVGGTLEVAGTGVDGRLGRRLDWCLGR
jgi:hypothetical protein